MFFTSFLAGFYLLWISWVPLIRPFWINIIVMLFKRNKLEMLQSDFYYFNLDILKKTIKSTVFSKNISQNGPNNISR